MRASKSISPPGGPTLVPRLHRTAAFATVLALLIISLLVVVLVGAAMLLRVETFTSSNAQKIAEARQNALYGIETAIADLQELAGPDQRVTATAALNRNATNSLWVPEPLPDAATNSSRHWTGVWDVSKTRYIPENTTPGRVTSNIGNGTTQVSPEPLKWLVSGGRYKSGGTESQTNNITPLNYPARIDASGAITGVVTPDDHVVLLGAGSVDLSDGSAATGDGIVVPKVPLYNPSSPQPANPSGAYAFWVGDEGCKAKFQAGAERKALADTYSGSTLDKYRIQVAQKLGIGSIQGNATASFKADGYDPADPDFLSALRRLTADTQIGYLPGGDKLGPDFRRRFHDLTLHSQGVLSDVKKGGLKQDLTVYLQQGDVSGKLEDSDLLYEDHRDDPAITDPSNPRAPFRSRYPGFHPTSNDGLPRIGLLRSWYNLTAPTVQPQTDTQHGMFPVISRCEWPAWLHMNLNLAGATYPFTVPANAFELRIHPTITLYNPYNVTLPGQTYTVTIPIGNNAVFGLMEYTSGTPPVANGNTAGSPTLFDFTAALGGATQMVFTIPASASALGPGESKIFTLANPSGSYSAAMQMDNDYATETNGFGIATTSATNPDGSNPNSYFSVPGTPDPVSPLKITATGLTTRFKYVFYRTPGSAAAARAVTLSSGGTVIYTVTDAPVNAGWLPIGTAANVFLTFTNLNFSGVNARDIDTRQPVSCFQRRPFVHSATYPSAATTAGGSLAPLLHSNIRANTEATPPAIWIISSTSASRFWGGLKNFADGTSSITIRGYAPPLFSSSGSATYERFPYTYIDSPSGSPFGVSGIFNPSDLGLSAPLFELRDPNVEILSLGGFQHVNLAGHCWQPSYVIGNSYVEPKLKGRDCYAGFYNYSGGTANTGYFKMGTTATGSTTDTLNRVYDASYMANDALWDRFFMSAATTAGQQSAALLANTSSLPNSRLLFRSANGQDYNALSSSSDKLQRGGAFLMNDGAFNVNSTSVEAWKALLSSRMGLKINSFTAGSTEAVFARMLSPGGGSGTFFAPSSTQPAAEKAGAYTGARRLSTNEIQVLAEEIVKQIEERGPFTSVGDFVNRRLTAELPSSTSYTETDTSRTGLEGALQSAIDSASLRLGSPGINSAFYDNGVAGSFYNPTKIQVFPGGAIGQITDVNISDANLSGAVVPRLAMLGRNWYYSAAGVPGFISQADILQAIGPLLTARSDTFRVRSYGEVKNPKTGKTEARAWCEAIVQRVPDPMKANPSADDIIWPERSQSPMSPANAAGRKFKVMAFRWLTPDEV